MICHICKKPIKKDEDIAVYSIPVKALDSNGNFDIFGDYLSCEKRVHAKCFKLQNNDGKSIKQSNNDIAKQLYKALCEVGENTSATEVSNFVENNLNLTDLTELISEWFRNRDDVV